MTPTEPSALPPTIPQQSFSMKGAILDYTIQTNIGIISGDDNRRYAFEGKEWKAPILPTKGMRVDFIVQDQVARAVYPCAVGNRQCDRVIAALLAIFLGSLGIHKFYMGYQTQGIILLICGTAGWVLFLPAIGAAIVGLIEGVIYLSQTQDQFQRNYIAGKKDWF